MMNLSANLHGAIPNMLEGSIAGNINVIGGEPVLESLNVTENGTYTPESGVDGFDEVVVDVPSAVLESLNVSTNGTYTPESGVDGFDEVVVDVPAAVLESLNVTANGTYTPESGVDGFDEVVVDVPAAVLESLNVTANGTYTPESGIDGFDEVVVDIPAINIITNRTQVGTNQGYYLPPQPLDKSLTVGKNYYLSVYNKGANITVQNIFKYNGAGNYMVYFQSGNSEATLALTDTTATFTNYPGSYRNIFIRLSEIDDSQILSS
jgi:hypothetical protein